MSNALARALFVSSSVLLFACAGTSDPSGEDDPAALERDRASGLAIASYRLSGAASGPHFQRFEIRRLPEGHEPGRITGVFVDRDGERLLDANFVIERAGQRSSLAVRMLNTTTSLTIGKEGELLTLEEDGSLARYTRSALTPEPGFDAIELECKVSMEQRPSDFSIKQGGGTIWLERGGTRAAAHMLRTISETSRWGESWHQQPSGYFVFRKDGESFRGFMSGIDPKVPRPTEMGPSTESTNDVYDADVEFRLRGTVRSGARVTVHWDYAEPSGQSHLERYDCAVK